MSNGRGLYDVLNESKYPSVDELLYAICDRIDNELCTLSDNIESEEYSKIEIIDQIDKIRGMIKRNI